MGQKARNAGKKQSKVCTKLADTKSLKHNIGRKQRMKVKEISKDQNLLETALLCPEFCVNGEGPYHYTDLADWIWESKTNKGIRFQGYPVLNVNESI
tara:strand:- start:2317 stop:2607 length:291 start_codon:yes stop_codon:yes gene_type:complete